MAIHRTLLNRSNRPMLTSSQNKPSNGMDYRISLTKDTASIRFKLLSLRDIARDKEHYDGYCLVKYTFKYQDSDKLFHDTAFIGVRSSLWDELSYISVDLRYLLDEFMSVVVKEEEGILLSYTTKTISAVSLIRTGTAYKIYQRYGSVALMQKPKVGKVIDFLFWDLKWFTDPEMALGIIRGYLINQTNLI